MTVADDLARLRFLNQSRWSDITTLDEGLRNNWSDDPPYLPSEDYSNLAAEYNVLIKRSQLNVLRLVVDALIDRLQVVGVRVDPSSQDSDDEIWSWWQLSSMDARHVLAMRDAASFRDGFVLTMPGIDKPRFTVLSPHDLAVEYDPYDPTKIVRAAKWANDRAWLYDDEAIYTLESGRGNTYEVIDAVEHAAGECPVTRLPNNLDSRGRSTSEIEIALPIQRRLHQTIMDRLLLQRAQAWRQRWASGVVVDRDEDGNPINPFKTGADTLLVGKSPDTKFGEFAQADLSGLLNAANDDIRSLALVTRTPPHYLPAASISNISAEALTALEAAFESRVNEHQVVFGEAFEHMIRLGGKMIGRDLPDEMEVIWANLELRSEAQRVDAATKLSSIGVPLEYLLERLSLSPQQIERIMVAKEAEDVVKAKAQAAAFGASDLGIADDEPDSDEG